MADAWLSDLSLAALLSTHPRLGKDSWLGKLDPEVIHMVVAEVKEVCAAALLPPAHSAFMPFLPPIGLHRAQANTPGIIRYCLLPTGPSFASRITHRP